MTQCIGDTVYIQYDTGILRGKDKYLLRIT